MLKNLVCEANLLGKYFTRDFSVSAFVLQSNLSQLRKATGYGLSKCKDALAKTNDNLEEAIKWLNDQAQKEGWTKAEKLKDRKTAQGTLAFFRDRTKRQAILVELNCETDFVARNEKFLDLTSQIAISAIQNGSISDSVKILQKQDLNKIQYLNESGKTIGDQVALSIGLIGENMSLRRAVIFNINENQHLGWYIHGAQRDPINSCHFGKYGSLVNFSIKKTPSKYEPSDLGRQIAQHIVGMKPTTLGEWSEELKPVVEQPPSADGQQIKAAPKIDENETRLLYQEFLMKPNSRVSDFLHEHEISVNNFVRFECGEELPAEASDSTKS